MLEEEYDRDRRRLPRHLRRRPEPERPFSFDIRPVADGDIPDIREIYNYYVTNSVVTFDEKKWSIAQWREKLTRHSLLHEDMKKFFEGFPATAHPMAMLSAMVASLSTYYPDDQDLDLNIVRLLAKAKTIAAFSYKKSIGQPFMYPLNHLSYTENFLHMMFAVPAEPYPMSATVEKALNLLLILHADHEQNCSTSTVRMVGSSGANLFASISAGISALWGPLSIHALTSSGLTLRLAAMRATWVS